MGDGNVTLSGVEGARHDVIVAVRTVFDYAQTDIFIQLESEHFVW